MILTAFLSLYLILVQKPLDHMLQETEELAGDDASFVVDRWERDASNPNAGYGITSVMESTGLLEKVNYLFSI